MSTDLDSLFPRYETYEPLVPVWCLTPDLDGCFHRFFDTSPLSPSGRYLAVTRLHHEDRLPRPGEVAEVVLVDLATGKTRVVAETRGWDTQLGAQAQWGPTDEQLFFNDLDVSEWRPYGVVVNPLTGQRRELEGTVYMVSPDGRWAASPCLKRTARTQAGYGVVVPPEVLPRNEGAPCDDGLWVTDVATGRERLLVSLAQIVEEAEPRLDPKEYAGGDFYAAHVKWSPTGERLQLVLRWVPHDGGKMRPNLITMKSDGTQIRVAIPASEWGDKGGHHPNWCPDGEHVMMNLNLTGEGLRFVQARWDGSELRAMHDDVPGSGHPSLHPDGVHVLTDAYWGEPVAFGDGTVPLRLIDLRTGEDRTLVRIRTLPPYLGPKNELRVDPHPAWDFGFTRVVFNACPEGTRRVYLADLKSLVPAGPEARGLPGRPSARKGHP